LINPLIIKEFKMLLQDIIFLQGEEAIIPLDILEDQGEEIVIEYLLQWDYGEGERYNYSYWRD